RLNGYRFRRQVPLGKYIVDFMCKESKLIIELDGGQHNEIRAARYDQERTVWIEANGYFVQRFWNSEVLDQCNAVLEVIQELCVKRKPSIMTFPHNKRGEGMR
ncbi:MAG TPA: DUF559 domain-containing protein, partial [Gammaproteobacteria bacterium]|nr:DUF559 domain-containing protein [Gammaproteobacteria bacterium]